MLSLGENNSIVQLRSVFNHLATPLPCVVGRVRAIVNTQDQVLVQRYLLGGGLDYLECH